MTWIEQAWRAAAKIHRVDHRVSRLAGWNASRCKQRIAIQDFRLHGGGVRSVLFSGHDARMEIAVRALRLAKRDLDVDAEIHGGSTDFSTHSTRRDYGITEWEPENACSSICRRNVFANRPPRPFPSGQGAAGNSAREIATLCWDREGC